MKSQKTTKDSSGSVRIQNNKIFWENNRKCITEIDIGNIVVIGEYTNSDGPYSDDWFISFVTKDGKWQSIPWYIENRDTLLNYLCTNFQNDFNISLLVGSFEWASVIRYPEHLKGESLFKLIPTEKYKEPKSFFDRVLNSIGLGGFDTNQYFELTDSVKNELTNSSR